MTKWNITFSDKAFKELSKLDKTSQQQINRLLMRILHSADPRSSGKALSANLSHYWRYRVGKYRIICEIRDQELVVEVITVGKRDTVYK